MTSSNLIAYLVLCAVGIVVVIAIYASIRKSLRELLEQLIRFPAGTQFYLRSLFLLLLFAALAKVVAHGFALKPDAAFMEYVWEVAAGLGDFFETLLWVFLLYLVQITVLAAVLRRKNDQ